jgi:4-amino-4-deoxy-L-arabinose transferase-like glycosyltransferase
MNSVSPTKIFVENNGVVWIVGAIAVVLFLITNLPWQLDDYDQAKQAFTSFEMVKEGHWFYQHTPHEHVATKPPLMGWISAGIFSLTRSWDAAWRLPSFLVAVAMSIVLFRAASSAYGSSAGLIALSAFGLNLLTPRLATLVRTDMPLALVIFLTGLLILKNIRRREAWNSRDRWSIFALLTVAMLIKGPIVYVFLLPGIAAFQLWRQKKGIASAWSGWWPWLASLGIFLVWVIGGIFSEPDFFNQVVVREFAGRFSGEIHRSQPLYFYLPHLLLKFFPWSVLVIAIAIVELRSRQWRIGAAFREMSPDTFWLVCWSLGGLIAMSIIPSKRVDRIFPVIPPLCLLVASQIGKMSSREQLREHIYRWSAVALLLSILLTSGYTISKVVSGYRHHRAALVIFGREIRHQAEAKHWRYEAIRAGDEGMLLYLEKTHFIEPDDAIREWNRGALDALVAPLDEAPRLMRELSNASLSPVRSMERKNEQGIAYVLLTR